MRRSGNVEVDGDGRQRCHDDDHPAHAPERKRPAGILGRSGRHDPAARRSGARGTIVAIAVLRGRRARRPARWSPGPRRGCRRSRGAGGTVRPGPCGPIRPGAGRRRARRRRRRTARSAPERMHQRGNTRRTSSEMTKTIGITIASLTTLRPMSSRKRFGRIARRLEIMPCSAKTITAHPTTRQATCERCGRCWAARRFGTVGRLRLPLVSSQDHHLRDPFGLEHARTVGCDQPDRVTVIEVEVLAVQLEGQQGVGVICMLAVDDRGGVEAVRSPAIRPVPTPPRRFGQCEQRCQRDTSPDGVGAPALDARDRECGSALRESPAVRRARGSGAGGSGP